MPNSKGKGGVTFLGFVSRALVLYLLIAVYIACPNDPGRTRAVCRGIDGVHSRFIYLEPIVKPYAQTARKKLAPYFSVADPYINQVTPYYQAVRPHFTRAYQVYFDSVHPRVVQGVEASHRLSKPYSDKVYQAYEKHAQPIIDQYTFQAQKWYDENIAEHVNFARTSTMAYYKGAYDFAAPYYQVAAPVVARHYSDTVVPFVKKSYKVTKNGYINHAHPAILTGIEHTKEFYHSTLRPAFERYYLLYIAPQISKIKAKIYEYRHGSVPTPIVQGKTVKLSEDVKKVTDADEIELEDVIASLRLAEEDTEEDEPESSPAPNPIQLSEEEKARLTAEKRSKLEALQTKTETELARLGKDEQRALFLKLVDIRTKTANEVKGKFNPSIKKLESDAAKLIKHLNKHFDNVLSDESQTLEQKREEVESLTSKAVNRIHRNSGDILMDLKTYLQEMVDLETDAVKKSYDVLSQFCSKSKDELSLGWTWLADVTVADWDRFHKLDDSLKEWKERFEILSAGELLGTDSPNPLPIIEQLAKEADELSDSFETIMNELKESGIDELKANEEPLVGDEFLEDSGAVEDTEDDISQDMEEDVQTTEETTKVFNPNKVVVPFPIQSKAGSPSDLPSEADKTQSKEENLEFGAATSSVTHKYTPGEETRDFATVVSNTIETFVSGSQTPQETAELEEIASTPSVTGSPTPPQEATFGAATSSITHTYTPGEDTKAFDALQGSQTRHEEL